MPLEIIRADITRMKVDAIVNAANTGLLGGGGVDGAIHAAAGPELLEECRQLGGCPTGQAKITKGYRLPARYIIHTPGPVWMGGSRGERQLLASCYRSSLALAEKYGCESIAFPMISTGAYGYPKDEALHVALDEITAFLLEHEMMVYIVTFGKEMFETTGKLFSSVRTYIDDARVETAERQFSRHRNIRPETAAQREVPDSVTEAASFSAPENAAADTDAFHLMKSDGSAPDMMEDTIEFSMPRSDITAHSAPKASFSGAGNVSELQKSGFRKIFGKRKKKPEAAPPAVETAPSPVRPSEFARPQSSIREEQKAEDAGFLFSAAPKAVSPQSLVDYIKAQDIGFSEALIRLIDEKGMTDVQCYKQANIDRKLFNHIKNKRDYKPAKKTALAFVIALHLDPGEAETLLNRAGYSLSSSSTMDLAIRYFLEHRFYNIHEINIMLYDLDLPLLGA